MSFTNPFSVKTPSVSTITAAEINAAGAILGSTIDPVGGGSYTPISPVEIGGAQGLRIPNAGTWTVLSGGTFAVASGGFISFTSGGTMSGTLALTAATTASDITMSGTAKVKLASRSITRVQAIAPYPTSATWLIDAQGTPYQNVNNSNLLVFALRVPHGATLTSVQASITPGVHGTLPTMPTLAVGYNSSAGFSTIFSVSDGSALGVYNASHEFGQSGLSHVVDRSARRYVAVMAGETGANYIAGLTVNYIKCTYTITEYDED
jgi:hypothetical protein